MKRSSDLSLKFANSGKLSDKDIFIDEYRRVMSLFVDILWEVESIPKFIEKEFTDQIKDKTWLSVRIIQSAAKQASGVIRGTREKQCRRQWQYDQFLKCKKFKQARKLKKIIDGAKVSKPDIKNVCPELDSRFVKLDWHSGLSFDGWLTISSIGNKMKFVIPLKKTKHFLEMERLGIMTKGVRLNKDFVTFTFDIPNPPKVEDGIVLGIDKGIINTFSLSTGVKSLEDKHGWTLNKIITNMNRKQYGSKAFEAAQRHRENFINWCFNQINLDGVKEVRAENIKNLRLGVKTSKQLKRWTYKNFAVKLERICEEAGVQLTKINPAYTSQRCSCCGWVQKSNRKGLRFKCKSCGFTHDADLNAATNISLDLCDLGKDWRKLNNRKGFYWSIYGREPIVPDTKKNDHGHTCS